MTKVAPGVKPAFWRRSAGLFSQAFGLSRELPNNKLCGRHKEKL